MKKLFLIVLLAATPLRAADIDVVRSNFIGYYTAAAADRASPRMQQALGELESATRNYTAPSFLLSDGSWSDINYQEVPSGSWSPWDHVKRLTVMVKAYQTPGQLFYRDPQLLVQINSALRKVMDFYGATIFPNGNWWFWTMGVPLDLGPTLVLMRGEVDQKTFDDLVFAMNLRIGNSPASRGLVGPTPTGENLVWSSYTHLCLALLKDDAVRLGRVREAMADVTLPSPLEGIKSDSSFHQHGAQLYTGGYGGSFANDVAKYALFTRGTEFALPAPSLNSFSNYVADGIAWSLFGNYFDVSVIGREVVRNSTTGFNGIAALLQSAQFDSARAIEIRSAAAKMLQSWQWGLPTELAGLATIVERARDSAAWPSGNRHYYESDYTVHRRPGWFASVKMFSNRTKSGERTNGENLFGSRQSDGRFYLSVRGDEFFGADIWPAFDWSRLPGITVERSATAANDIYGFGLNAIAGGAGDGRNGVSAMEIIPLNSTLRARKSWFFFDDAIVFLTSGITATSANGVETVVNQWPLANANASVSTGSNWSVADGVGYYFPTGSRVQTQRDIRSGTWASLGASTDTTTHTKTFLTMWIDHGVMPVNATAEYVIVPNTTPEAMRIWVASNGISIVANNATASAVRRGDTLGIAFWGPGSVEGYESNAAAIIYVSEAKDAIAMNVADPANGVGTIRVTIPGRFSGTNAIAGYRSTTIDVPRNGGRTFSVRLTRLGAVKRRAAR